MTAQCTIHTMEMRVVLHQEDLNGKAYEWRDNVYAHNFSYITSGISRCSSADVDEYRYRFTVNPHKMTLDEYGRGTFAYKTATEIENAIAVMKADLCAPNMFPSRVDIAVDFDVPYHENDKLNRWIIIFLTELYGLGNRFIADDFVTLERKTTRAQNGDRRNKTLEVEHYNRILLNQANWNNEPIINRFEFRSMRGQAGPVNSIQEIAERWIERLNSIIKLNKADINSVSLVLNDYLWEKWNDFSTKAGSTNGHTFSVFLKANAPFIYTSQQCEDLFRRFGSKNPKQEVKNLKHRNKHLFVFYSKTDLVNQVGLITEALYNFIHG